ncbi:DUF6427 family protein [Faecalibacter bovis]|uniref:EpsG family protein n=1 Tax=Faecalibacter bovis TaxID=2898187 RepID=A0ABX7XFN8_9FLAO|nr:DUF6427 family protein [Faecalibacter bovis]MBS7332823.1 hypothetical protein [Weeksellaceae bacterium]QTV06695.1 hypothetical protein J9309_05095 [Faecalibacter bovis]
MLVNLLAKRNFFIQIFIIVLFFGLGATNFNSIYLSKLEFIGFALTILTIAYVAYKDSNNELISKNSYSTWFYMLCMMPCIGQLLDYKIAGSLLLITYVTTELMYFETEHTSKFEAFDIGMFLSFAILLNPPLFILGIVIFAYFLTLKAIDPSILILAILGFLVPVLVFAQISYLMDFKFLVDYYREALFLDYYNFEIKHIFLLPVVGLLAMALLNYVRSVNKEVVEVKRVFFLIFLMLISFLIISALFGGSQLIYLSFFGLIMMIIFSKDFANKKPQYNWLKETILWGYLICMLFFNFYDRIPRIYSLITEVSF